MAIAPKEVPKTVEQTAVENVERNMVITRGMIAANNEHPSISDIIHLAAAISAEKYVVISAAGVPIK